MAFNVYPITKVIPVRNEAYFDFLLGALPETRKRVWAAVFIVNPRVRDDEYRAVRALLSELAYAVWRNVDVRVIVGTSEAEDIEVANLTAHAFLRDLGVPVRRFSGRARRSLHSKYVLLDDDLILLGSHNWAPDVASGDSNEDSVAVVSGELSTILRDEFVDHWVRAGDTEDSP